MDESDIVEVDAWHVRVWRRYQASWFDTYFRFSAPVAIILFALSVVVNFYAGVYATTHASNFVEDIVLSNTPVFDVGFIFIWGVVALIAAIVVLCVSHPKRIPFVLHSLSAFYLIRAAFVSMTHLEPYPAHAVLDVTGLVARQFGGADLFFSAHTGAPFLMALIFWHKPALRYLFLTWSGVFGVIVLLGHLHYTIDVFSAFFITYGIYHIALWLFPRERALFMAE
jgi:hypothetical protein